MPSSKTELTNLALAELGAKRITDFEGDGSQEAQLARLHFDHVRDTLLRSHPFSFANRTVALSALATPPVDVSRWDKAWQLPPDCVRIRSLATADPDIPVSRFEKAGTILHTIGLPAVTLRYVSNAAPLTEWDALFVDAFRFKLASEIGTTLDVARGEAALQKFKAMALPDAARADAREDSSDENRTARSVAARSGLVRARYSASRYGPYS